MMGSELVGIEYPIYRQFDSEDRRIKSGHDDSIDPVDTLEVGVYLGHTGLPKDDYVVYIYSRRLNLEIYRHPEGYVGIIEETQSF